jgi:signal transduction histidine kinase
MKTRPGWQLAWIAQVVLIVLPVVILSAVALNSLREDKAAIDQEARDRARSLASDLLPAVARNLTKTMRQELHPPDVLLARLSRGQGEALPEIPSPAKPADWPDKLSPEQAHLWQIAQDATFRHEDPQAARNALKALDGPRTQRDARAVVRYSLLTLAERFRNEPNLAQQATDLAASCSTEVTESGTSVRDLALLLALRQVISGRLSGPLAEELKKSVTEFPSFLTPELLNVAERVANDPTDARLVESLKKTLEAAERGREVVRWLLQQLPGRQLPNGPAEQVVDGDGSRYLALSISIDGGWSIAFVREQSVAAFLTPLLRTLRDGPAPSNLPRLPEYLGVALEIGGLRIPILPAGENRAAPVLAAATGEFDAQGNHPFRLQLELAQPSLLYSPYHRRLVVTEWLVLTAAAVALLGLLRLWHSYQAQARLNELKSNLVSSVSHELRAPIAAVRLMAETLESDRIDGETKRKDYYRLIVRECRRLSALVENVLDFSRIEQGRKQYHFEPLDPMALARHTVMLMEPSASERQVRLTIVEPRPECDTLQPSWDGEAVEQSLVNLIDNAIKHSPAGAEVRVEMEHSNGTVRIWVADQGPGIPVSERQRIFELFYRQGSELRRETPGAGIGLSIVKHVAEAHGGRVLLESVVGQGSRFGLELPR